MLEPPRPSWRCWAMNPSRPMLIVLGIIFGASTAFADMPPNVRCAVLAQEKARSAGAGQKMVYNRTFEACMFQMAGLPQQEATVVLKPHRGTSPATEESKFTGTWVRVWSYVWVLKRD